VATTLLAAMDGSVILDSLIDYTYLLFDCSLWPASVASFVSCSMCQIGFLLPAGVRYPVGMIDTVSGRHAMKLISQTGSEGLPLSSLICEW